MALGVPQAPQHVVDEDRDEREVPRVELGPLSYGIYLYMQSAVGRGAGAALGVVAIVLVAAGTWAATALARRSGAALFRS